MCTRNTQESGVLESFRCVYPFPITKGNKAAIRAVLISFVTFFCCFQLKPVTRLESIFP